MSSVEAQVSGGLRWGQGLWLQQTWETHHRATEQTTLKMDNYTKEVLVLL